MKHISVQIILLLMIPFSSILLAKPGDSKVTVMSDWELAWSDTTYTMSNVKIAPDDSYVISCGISHYMQIYDVATGKIIDTINSGNGAIFIGFMFSPSGKYLVAQAGGQLYVYDAKNLKLLQTLKDTSNYSGANNKFIVDISSDDKYVALASGSNFYVIWDWQSGKVVKREVVPFEPDPNRMCMNKKVEMTFAKFSRDAKYFYTNGIYSYTVYYKPYYHTIKRTLSTETWNETAEPKKWTYYLTYSKSGEKACCYIHSPNIVSVLDTREYIPDQQYPVIRDISVPYVEYCCYDLAMNDKYLLFSDNYLGHTYFYDIYSGDLIAEHKESNWRFPDISVDGKNVAAAIGNIIYLYKTPWTNVGNRGNSDKLPLERDFLCPNPATNTVELSMKLAHPEELNAVIYNELGVKVLAINLGICSQVAKIDVANLPDGIYWVSISGETYARTNQLVIMR